MLKKEEEEEEEEWERLKGVEAGRLERERLEEERLEREEAEAEQVSSGEETVGAGGRAVEVKREDEDEEERSLLGGVSSRFFLSVFARASCWSSKLTL